MKFALLFLCFASLLSAAEETKRLLADVVAANSSGLLVRPLSSPGGPRPAVGEKDTAKKLAPRLADITTGLTVVTGMPKAETIPEGVRIDVDVVEQGVVETTVQGEARRLRQVRVVAVEAVHQ